MTSKDKQYSEDLVLLPRRMTNAMVIAWFKAERRDRPISECWQAVVDAFADEDQAVSDEP